ELPASMESAVCSGWMAAEQVLAERGVDKQLHVEHRDLEGLTGLVNRAATFWPTKGAQRILRSVRQTLNEA
ncbi:MAG: hypothetical protein ACLFVJ_22330, partial [Persicimonas sp.]